MEKIKITERKRIYEAKVSELIRELKKFDQKAQVLVASDEELNVLYQGIEVADFDNDSDTKYVVIYGLSQTELLEKD